MFFFVVIRDPYTLRLLCVAGPAGPTMQAQSTQAEALYSRESAITVSRGNLLWNRAKKRFVDFPIAGFLVILGIAECIARMMRLFRIFAHGPGAI